ncbi:MAG: hypothetical protein ACX94B_00015 [Henriciella sp.]
MYQVTRRENNRVRKRRRSPRYFGFQTTLFLTLVTAYCLERVLSPTVISSDLTCIGKRTVLLGETASEMGVYHVLALIALVSLFLAILEFALQWVERSSSHSKRRWALPIINALTSLGLLAIIATPWAYYNVGHPLSDRIYQVQAMVGSGAQFERPGLLSAYSIDPEIWRCDNGPCGGDASDTVSTYHHRFLDFSFRFVLISDCMSSEFNLATARAAGVNTTTWNGERRITARAFFDSEGRFVDPHNKWISTPLMLSQLTELERQPPNISFDKLMTQLSNWTLQTDKMQKLPEWVDWERLEEVITSGESAAIYSTGDILIGVRMKNGTEFLGTQTRAGDLERALVECDQECTDIEIFR